MRWTHFHKQLLVTSPTESQRKLIAVLCAVGDTLYRPTHDLQTPHKQEGSAYGSRGQVIQPYWGSPAGDTSIGPSSIAECWTLELWLFRGDRHVQRPDETRVHDGIIRTFFATDLSSFFAIQNVKRGSTEGAGGLLRRATESGY